MKLSEDQRNLLTPCVNADLLHSWVQYFTGLDVPRRAVCPNHDAPFDYLVHSYFEKGDVVVWAPRGGGKTRLAAVATLLDLLHKPGCAIRILGGSLQQSLRMWEHLFPDFDTLAARLVGAGAASKTRSIATRSGSNASVLAQSQRAVRGLRVQKLRCDEVELFDPQIWTAAQLATRSVGSTRGTIEAISTFHSPFGLMRQIVDSAKESGTRVIRWCLLDVLDRCDARRDCGTCPLWDECKGVAKTKCDGFLSIDDAVKLKRRVSLDTWNSEMLCNRPTMQKCVFPNFSREIHVAARRGDEQGSLTFAIDFGFNAPFVCLWIFDDGANVHVRDEYVQPQRTIAEHLEQIESRPPGRANRICCDPAGGGRNDQTAESNVQFLRRHGYRVSTKHSRIVEGLELIRAALRPAHGDALLTIDPRCERLIAAMEQYHYPAQQGGELPLKDGTHDHLIDALRYFYVNRIMPGARGAPRRY